jgi:hypothetical protein
VFSFYCCLMARDLMARDTNLSKTPQYPQLLMAQDCGRSERPQGVDLGRVSSAMDPRFKSRKEQSVGSVAALLNYPHLGTREQLL